MPKKFHTSATQITTFRDCQRKWWLHSILKLPEPPSYAKAFGTVFHGVMERYLRTNDLGVGPDIIPDGWLVTEEGTVSNEDGELILSLLDMGIEAGLLDKLPGRLIEHPFKISITDDTDIVGYVDLLYPNEGIVVDHKTTKMWRYALSEKKLATDVQMLIYAAAYVCRYHKEFGEAPDVVILRHNQFLKDPTEPAVRMKEVTVPTPVVLDNWDECVATTHGMEALRKNPNADWEDIPPPENVNTCNKYGGCPYMGICGKRETTIGYTKRINKVIKESNVGIFDEYKKRLKENGKKVEKKEESETVEQEVFKTPPWAFKDCKACEGTGINSKGSPCRICDQAAKANEQKDSSYYEFVSDLDGWILSSTIDIKEENNGDEEDSKKDIEDVREEETVEKEEPEKKKEETVSKRKANKGRPKAGYTLCVNCAPTRFGSKEVVSMDAIYKEAKAKVAEYMEDDFYLLDSWKRKDRLAIATSKIVSELGCVFVVARMDGGGLDYKTCLEIVREEAQFTIEH